ncbi:MAG: tetratricopeptide repeat protein, partial [Chloroflexi bacterium]|nr:tetratricopeptide repeat protein [Chloroflexota bacterium]
DELAALADYSAAIDLLPDAAVYRVPRGTTYLARGDFARAADDLGTALDSMTDDLLPPGDYGARDDIWLDELPAPGDHLAAAQYTALVRDLPRPFWVYYQRGLAWAGLEDYERAIADFSVVIDELEPTFYDAHYQRGLAYLARGELDRAAADFRQVLALDPWHAAAELGLGDIAFQQGAYHTALDHYVRYLDLTGAHTGRVALRCVQIPLARVGIMPLGG